MKKKTPKTIVGMRLAVMMAPLVVVAQGRATVGGTVKDQEGNRLQDVVVTVFSPQESRSDTTSRKGRFGVVVMDASEPFRIRLEKEGYKSIGEEIDIPAKIDGYPVIDLPFEILVRNRHFRRVFDMALLDEESPDGVCQEIRKRAEGFREETYKAVKEPGTPGRQAGK